MNVATRNLNGSVAVHKGEWRYHRLEIGWPDAVGGGAADRVVGELV